MTQYGKIIIIADSIAEAEKELATIKALANVGAVYGKGSTNESVEIRMGNVPSAPPSNYRCNDCSMCSCPCHTEEKDDYDEVDEMLDKFVMTASPIAQRMLDELLSNL